MKRTRAFLSYSKYDREWVRVLHEELLRLVGDGVDVFWDQAIEARSTWNSFLEREVDSADHMILVATPEAVGSPDVQKERNLFVQLTKMERLYTVCRTSLCLPQAWTTKQLLSCGNDAEFRVVIGKLAGLLRGVAATTVKVPSDVVNPHWHLPSRLPDALYQRLVDLVVHALGKCTFRDLAPLGQALELERQWHEPFSHVELKAIAAIQRGLGERQPVAQSLALLDKLDGTVIPTDSHDQHQCLCSLRQDIEALREKPPPASQAKHRSPQSTKKPREQSHGAALSRYRNAILSSCGTIEFAGFESKVQVPIKTESLFVQLHAVVRGHGELREYTTGTEAAKGAGSAQEHGTVTLEQGLALARRRNQRGIVILGDPGSGKTTLLRHTAWAAIHDPAQFGLAPNTLPVLLPLRRRQPGDFTRSLVAFLHHELPKHAELPADFAKQVVASQPLLVLVDGFDEVDPKERADVVRWLSEMVEQRPDWTFVVTSRYAGYQGDERERFDEHFLELHLQPLLDEGIQQFVHKWYAAVEATLRPETGPSTAKEAADDLLQKLIGKGQTSTRLLEMAGNPLLLTNICLVHRSRGRHLPRDRHELYRECIDLLLARWPDLAQRRQVTHQEGTLAMQAVALHMQELGVAIAPRAELLPPLTAGLALAGLQIQAIDFLKHVQHDCGLLTGWSGDRFGFLHLGFQEYLAAKEIARLAAKRAHANDSSRQELRQLASRFGEDKWREVILLLLAIDGNLCTPFFEEALQHEAFATDGGLRLECLQAAAQKDPTPFVEFLRINAGTAKAAAKLGARGPAAMEAIRSVAPAVADALRQDLPHLSRPVVASGDLAAMSWTTLGGYAHAGRVRGVKRVKGIDLLEIPAGEFLMGSKPSEGHDDERPSHRVLVQHPFWLARTTVTNQQYRAFIEATNYARPASWKNRRFNGDDQPVVDVSWEDAQAFCSWAGLRLPSEAEWEYACRAGTVTPFSFGENITPEQVNYGKTGLYRERTVPVGSLPANAWGLHEMHGNVSEWCQDAWHRNYEGAPADGTAWEVGGSGFRVVRGGSWLDYVGYCRSAYRSRWHPGDRYDILGFRPASSSL